MPPPVVPAVPAAGHSLHDIEGVCDYCGEPCDSTQDELNALACTFEGCASSGVYHQHCIEAFLKSIRLDKQRKTGFQCPRGNGKATKFDKPCPGRITKSHPIHARNENSKKRRKAKMPEPPPAPVGAAGKKGGKGKDDKKADSKAVDGKKEGKAADSKKEGKSKSSFLVPSSSSKSSASAPAAPAAPAPKPTVALLVRSSLPPAAKAAAKSSSAGTDPLSPSSKSGGIGSSGAGASGGGSGGVAVKVLSKSWSAAAAGLKDAAAAAVGSVSGSSGSGGGGVPVNAWSSSPGIVSAPSKGKSSESKADKVSSPKDPSSQQDASTGGKASDKPAAGGGGEEKSKKDKAGGKGSSQDGEGKTENGGGSGKGEGKGRQKKKGKEQVVPAPAVPAPVTAAVPANSVWKAKPAALLLRPEAGKAQGQNQQQAQSQQQPHQQKQPPQQQQQQQQGKQEGKATRESQVKSDTTVAPSSLPPPSVPPPIKTTTTVSPDPPASSAHLPPSTSLSVWTKDSSSLHSSTLHTSSLHSAPPSSSSSSSSSSSTTPTECEFSTTSGLSSPPSSFPSTPRAMTSLSPSASMSSCADHLAPEPVTEPASSPAAEPVAEPSVVGSEAPSSSGEGGRRVGTEVSIQDGLQEKADSQVQQQQQQQQPPQQHQKQSQQQQQQQQDKVVVAEDVAAAAAAAAAEASKGSSVSNASNAAGSGDASPAASTVATGAVPSATASNVAASVGATNMSTAGDMPGAAVARSPTGGLRRWSDACRFALETNRRRVYVRQLQELGFPLGEAAQAVLVHGGDLGGCLNHLLVLHECSCRPSALSASTPSPFVDISLELQALSEIMSAGSLPQDLLEHALVLASGDISHALHLIISHPHGLPSSLPSTQPFPFYSSPLSSSTTTTTTTAATAATATTTTSSSPHSSLPPPHPFLSNHCIPQHPTAFPVGPSDPVFAHLSRSSSPSPSPSPPSPLPDYTIASPASFSHTPFTTLTPTTTPSSSVHHTSLLSGIWSSSSPNLPSAAHASPVPPPGFGPSLNASPAPLGNSSSFGTLETPPNLSSGSGWNFNGLPELKSQQRAEPVGGCEATRKVYVPESIGRLWGGAGGAGMAAQEDSQWLCGVNSDRSSGTASGLSSCSNSSHGYSQFSEDDGLGDSLLLLPGDEEDLFSRILPGLLG